MASTTKWVTNLRQSIKNTCGTGWSVRGRESKGELITKVTFRYPDNQGRTATNVNLAWNAKNTTKIITAVRVRLAPHKFSSSTKNSNKLLSV